MSILVSSGAISRRAARAVRHEDEHPSRESISKDEIAQGASASQCGMLPCYRHTSHVCVLCKIATARALPAAALKPRRTRDGYTYS